MFALTIVVISVLSACLVFPNSVLALDKNTDDMERFVATLNVLVMALTIVTLSLLLAYRV